jgi:hypothetical protein
MARNVSSMPPNKLEPAGSSLSIYHLKKLLVFATIVKWPGELISQLSTDCIYSLSYIPLVAPATSIGRLPTVVSIADSFIYVVSRMGVTGFAAGGTMSSSLPELCIRVRKYAGQTPIAVGFGVNTREHFLSVGNLADGVVIGSKIITLIKEATLGTAASVVQAYCKEVSRPQTQHEQPKIPDVNDFNESISLTRVKAKSMTATASEQETEAKGLVDEPESLKKMPIKGIEVYS